MAIRLQQCATGYSDRAKNTELTKIFDLFVLKELVKTNYENLFTRLQGISFFITEEQLQTLPLKFRSGSAERLLEILCKLCSPLYPIFP